MKKLIATIAVALMVLAGSLSAHAQIFFDPTGGGGGIEITGFDWAPGAGVAKDSVIFSVEDSWTWNSDVYLQSTLSNLLTPGGLASLDPAYEINAIAGFSETGTYYTLPGLSFASFDLLPSDLNYFEVYIDTAGSLDHTTDGTLILSGHFTSLGTSTYSTAGDIVPYLDNYPNGTLAQPDVAAMEGGGGTKANMLIDFLADGYFTLDEDTLAALLAQSLFITLDFVGTQSVPFTHLDPPDGIETQAGGIVNIDYLLLAGNGDYAHINGYPNADGSPGDFAFEVDGASSFGTVPEPATILLSGLGLLVLGFFCRRNQVA